MKLLKKLSLMALVMGMVLSLGACGKKEEEKSMNNFVLKYNVAKQVDKVICNFEEYEDRNFEMNPMHSDTKLKSGYTYHIFLPEEKIKFSIQVIDEGKVVNEFKNQKVDLSEGKQVEVQIVENKDGEFELKVVEK